MGEACLPAACFSGSWGEKECQVLSVFLSAAQTNRLLSLNQWMEWVSVSSCTVWNALNPVRNFRPCELLSEAKSLFELIYFPAAAFHAKLHVFFLRELLL